MRGNIFISWPFLDQNLGAEFLSKHFKLFWMWKLYRVDLTPCQPHLALWKMPLCGPIYEYFSCFHSSCQWRINILEISYKTESHFSSVFFKYSSDLSRSELFVPKLYFILIYLNLPFFYYRLEIMKPSRNLRKYCP